MKSIYKIFLALFIFLLSCEKEEIPPEVITVTLNKNAVNFLKVTPGKYLIYKDSATLEIDSIIITTCELSYFNYPETAYTSEKFDLIYTKKTASNSSSTWFSGTARARLLFSPLMLVDNIDPYFLPNITLYYDENTVPLASYIVDGITYTNVIIRSSKLELEITHPNYLRAEYYWAEGVGIIQKSIVKTNGVRKTHYLIRHN